MGHENYAQCKFYVYVSTDVTADAAFCWTLAASKERTENLNAHQTLFIISSAKAIPIQETQKLHSVDAAASDAENLFR